MTFTASANGFVYLEIHQINAIIQPFGTYSIFAGANLPGTVTPGDNNDNTYTATGNEVVAGGLMGDILSAGTTNSTLLGQGGNDTLYGADNGSNILSGGHGNDTIYAGFNSNSTVIFGDAGDDELYGKGGADAMLGGAGSDYLDGGLGNDNLTGGLGRDILIGGANDDNFIFNSVLDPGRGAARDLIRDFATGDKIDLEVIDVKPRGVDQDFKFIGTQAFHHKAGELRVQFKGANFTIVQGHINGDGKADFEIGLIGHHVLNGAVDFDL